jgi:hypothetical protein
LLRITFLDRTRQSLPALKLARSFSKKDKAALQPPKPRIIASDFVHAGDIIHSDGYYLGGTFFQICSVSSTSSSLVVRELYPEVDSDGRGNGGSLSAVVDQFRPEAPEISVRLSFWWKDGSRRVRDEIRINVKGKKCTLWHGQPIAFSGCD